jgi:hypothetical protein
MGQNLFELSKILCFGWIERTVRPSSALLEVLGVLGVLRVLRDDPVGCGPRGVCRDVLICGGRVRIMSEHQVFGDGSSHRCCGRRCGLLLLLLLQLVLAPTLPVEQEAVAVPLNRVVGHVHVHLDLVAHPFPQIADSGHTAKTIDP